MIWDHAPGIELHMQYGIVNGGGHFEIGTEEEPFCEESALIKLRVRNRWLTLFELTSHIRVSYYGIVLLILGLGLANSNKANQNKKKRCESMRIYLTDKFTGS